MSFELLSGNKYDKCSSNENMSDANDTSNNTTNSLLPSPDHTITITTPTKPYKYDDRADDCLFVDEHFDNRIQSQQKNVINKSHIHKASKGNVDNQIKNKISRVGRFWTDGESLKPNSLRLLKDLNSFYTDENLERLIVPRAIKSMGLQKKYHFSDVVQKEIDGISLRAIEWLVTNYSKGIKIVLYNVEQKNRIDIHDAYETQSNHFKRHLFDPFCRHGRVNFHWKFSPIDLSSSFSSTKNKKLKHKLDKTSKNKNKIKKKTLNDNTDTDNNDDTDIKQEDCGIVNDLDLQKTTTTTNNNNNNNNKFIEIVLVTTVGQLNFMRWADQNGILEYANTHHDEIQSTMEKTLSKVNHEKKKCKEIGEQRKRKALTLAPENFCSVYRVDTVFQMESPTQSPRHYD